MSLKTSLNIPIRFSEVDALGMVWHGNYVKYLEDAREYFGSQYELSYLAIKQAGYYTPVVDLQLSYKKSLRYGEEARVEIVWEPVEAAKLIFSYRIYNQQNELCLSAQSTQVFMNDSDELEWYFPQFYLNWKSKHGI